MPPTDRAPFGAPCWIDLLTSDPERASAFYGELFGWAVTDPGPEYGGYTNFTKGGVPVAGCMRNSGDMGTPDGWSVYLAVEDATAAVAAAEANGATVVVPAMEVQALGSMAVVVDPFQAATGLWQPGEHVGFGLVAEPGAPVWFELHTRDYEGALRFYRDVFGWDTHTASDAPDFRYSTLGEGEGALAGVMDDTVLPEGGPGPRWEVYLGVDDADAAVTRVDELGGKVLARPEDSPYGRLAEVADPTGAAFRIVGV